MEPKDWVLMTTGVVDMYALAKGAELQTDGAIRGKDISHLDGRELVMANDWVTDSPGGHVDFSSNSKGTGQWDQFEANARLKDYKKFAFDENLYTKRLDMSKISADQIKKADRLAKEIDSQTSTNIHLQEERGHALERDIDEEALYSGVIGTGGYAQGGPKGFGGGEEGGDSSGPWQRGGSQKQRGAQFGQQDKDKHAQAATNPATRNFSGSGPSRSPVAAAAAAAAASSATRTTGSTGPNTAAAATAPVPAAVPEKKILAPANPKAWSQAPQSIKTAAAGQGGINISAPPPGLGLGLSAPPAAAGAAAATPAAASTATTTATATTASAATSAASTSAVPATAPANPVPATGAVAPTAPAASASAPAAPPADAAAAAAAGPAKALNPKASEWKPNVSAAPYVPKAFAPAAGPVPPQGMAAMPQVPPNAVMMAPPYNTMPVQYAHAPMPAGYAGAPVAVPGVAYAHPHPHQPHGGYDGRNANVDYNHAQGYDRSPVDYSGYPPQAPYVVMQPNGMPMYASYQPGPMGHGPGGPYGPGAMDGRGGYGEDPNYMGNGYGHHGHQGRGGYDGG